MKYDNLYHFISPITGRVLCDSDYVLVGDTLGIATPSPILIDLRLDLINLREDLDTTLASSFIIKTATDILPNAQALDVLANGYMINTAGVISTTNAIPLPDLPYKNIWIGDSTNRPIANSTITLGNLPTLGMPTVPVLDPIHGGLVGNIWEGTITGRPVESGRFATVFADLLLINARFLSANFIMGSGNIVLKTAMPASQFLDELAAGLLKQDIPGEILRAIPGIDYVDVVDPIENRLSVWADAGVGTPKMLINTGITVDDQNRMSGINTVNTVFVIASDQITSNTSVFGLNNVGTRQIQIYDQWNGPGRLTKSVNFIGPAHIFEDINFIVPDAVSTTNQVLTDVGSDGGNRVLRFQNILPDGLTNNLLAKGVDENNNPIFINALLAQNRFWLGNANNLPIETQYLPVNNLTNLTSGRFWQGDNAGRPVEVELNIAPTDATYVLLTPNNNLPNSQNLLDLTSILIRSGILKFNNPVIGDPHISLAIGGADPTNDYVRPSDLLEVAADLESQLAVITGYGTIAVLSQFLIDIGFIGGGAIYGNYIRTQSLNVKNTWLASDFNDEAHNAVGDWVLRFPSGYDADNRGHGTLWFDSAGRNPDSIPAASEGGLRIFSWDSGGDSIGSDDPIAPVHMGIFGYQNKYSGDPFTPNPTPKYKGFIFRSEFHNESTSDAYYRFPKNFGLYCVQRSISNIGLLKYGWSSIDKIFEYDYNNFDFYKPVRFLTSDAITIPVGTTAQRPSNPTVGMLRCNTDI